ncbi:hypothetical protein ABEQ76_21600, partial [Bacillus velezensis]
MDKNKKKSLVITSNLNTPQSKKYLYESIVNGQNILSQYSKNTKILINFCGFTTISFLDSRRIMPKKGGR